MGTFFFAMTKATSTRPMLWDATRTPLHDVEQAMTTEAGRTIGHFRGMRLDSAFQPIYSLPHSRIVGHEALLRATDASGAPLAPPVALGAARSHAEQVFADRLSRAIHMQNYRDSGSESGGPAWLFLNVSTQAVVHGQDFGSFFGDLLARHAFPARRVVVEILEDAFPDLAQMADAVARYRDLGCLVAVDDFGADSSNIDRIWRISPDIVKLDRTLIAAAAHAPKARRVLPATIALIHEAGSLALIEGVETEHQATIAMDSDTDLVQGYYFGRPAPVPLRHGDGGIAALARQHGAAPAPTRQRQLLQAYADAFQQAARRLKTDRGLATACIDLLTIPRVDRCYLIDAAGTQIGASVLPPGRQPAASRFAPLEDAEGANWSRKPYHYRALAHPGALQMSRPYLSVANSCLCVTLSLTVELHEGMRVLCCDINWEE